VLHSAIVGSHDALPEPMCKHRPMRPTVLIVDDHDEFRASVRALLGAEGFDVVGVAANGKDAVREARRLEPGLILLDINLPDRDGFSVAEELALLANPPDVVLISSRDPAAYGPKLARSATRGFLSKSDLTGPTLLALLQ
jgi:DNA-binding NarL/FixJ family response regulator